MWGMYEHLEAGREATALVFLARSTLGHPDKMMKEKNWCIFTLSNWNCYLHHPTNVETLQFDAEMKVRWIYPSSGN